MKKKIIELNQDEKGYTYTIIEVSQCTNQEHIDARKELEQIRVKNGTNSSYAFFLLKADSDSFKSKCWGNAVEKLEEIGYTF